MKHSTRKYSLRVGERLSKLTKVFFSRLRERGIGWKYQHTDCTHQNCKFVSVPDPSRTSSPQIVVVVPHCSPFVTLSQLLLSSTPPFFFLKIKRIMDFGKRLHAVFAFYSD